MLLQDILPPSTLEPVMGVLDLIKDKWRIVKTIAVDPSMKTLNSFAANWVGYGVNVMNPDAPTITLFLKDHPVHSLFPVADLFGISLGLDKSLRAIRVEFEGGIAFQAIPTTHGAVSEGTVAQPGAGLTSDASNPGKGTSADGTLGAFLKDKDNDIWILSANHVLAFNGIFGTHNIKLEGTPTAISTDVRFVKLKEHDPNQVDAAIAKLTDPKGIDPDIPGLNLIGDQPPFVVAKNGLVTKVGATTSTTHGSLAYFCPHIEVNIPSCRISAATFTDQWIVKSAPGESFSNEGDSGSLAIYGSSFLRPLGMLIAQQAPLHGNGGVYSVVTPMANVLSALNEETHLGLELLLSHQELEATLHVEAT